MRCGDPNNVGLQLYENHKKLWTIFHSLVQIV